MGGFSQAQGRARHEGLQLSVITCPRIAQPCGVGTRMVSILQMGKLKHGGVQYLFKAGHMANEWQS